MAVGVMDAPDQLTEVKFVPRTTSLFLSPPLLPPRISDSCGAFCVAGGCVWTPLY